MRSDGAGKVKRGPPSSSFPGQNNQISVVVDVVALALICLVGHVILAAKMVARSHVKKCMSGEDGAAAPQCWNNLQLLVQTWV